MPDPFVTRGLQNSGCLMKAAWNLDPSKCIKFLYVSFFVVLGASMDPQIRSYLSIEAYLYITYIYPPALKHGNVESPFRWEGENVATLNPEAKSFRSKVNPK